MSLLFTFTGCYLTNIQQAQSSFIFETGEASAYKAQIVDSPKQKDRSIQLSLYLPQYQRNIVAYIEDTPLSKRLDAGSWIYFYSKLDTLKAYQSPNNFDYVGYMHNRGFSASTYIPAQRWDFCDDTSTNLKIEALKLRSKILEFYKSLNLNDEEFAVLSALTLGYKEHLSQDTIDDFRTAGTAHLMAISGLHVGIIFFALSFLLSFIKDRKNQWVKLLIIILLLWIYVFVIGLPASAVRACIMTSLLCIAYILNRRRVALNTLAIAAFGMLLYNPLSLFDISFQFSFSATAFIIWLQPKAERLIRTKRRSVRYLWNTLSISIIAQLGIFPLSIFYFGYFPTYFFLSNLIIIPLAMGLVYCGLFLAIIYPIYLLTSSSILGIPSFLIKADIWLITTINSFIAKLPLSQISDISIDKIGVILIYLATTLLLIGFVYKKTKPISYSLLFLLFLSLNLWYLMLKNENKLSIYYNTEIRYNIHGHEFKIDKNEKEKYLLLNNEKVLFLSNTYYYNLVADNKHPIDLLILAGNQSHSLYDLIQIFEIKKIVLDSSLSKQSAKKLAKECQELGISYHDIRENDAYHIFF